MKFAPNSLVPLLALSAPLASSFTTPRASCSKHSGIRQSAKLHMDASNKNRVESQREDCKDVLNRIEILQDEIQGLNSTDDLETRLEAVQIVEKDVDQLVTQFLLPLGLSRNDYTAAVRVLIDLPPSFRLAFVKALEMDDAAAGDYQRIPDIVTKLYEQRFTLTPQRLSDSLKLAQVVKQGESASSNTTEDAGAFLEKFFERDTDDQFEENVKQLLGRVARKEESKPTAKDLEVLTSAFDSAIFSTSDRPIELPWGYIIRGQNKKKSGQELIEALDSKLPSTWDCTVSYMPDISNWDEASNAEEGAFFPPGNALVLLKNDFSLSTSPWFYRFATACALGTTLLFSAGVYGGNENVLKQLTDASSLGDLAALGWFNAKVGEILFPLAVILGSHELGHFLVSKKEKIETSSFLPTLLPFVGNLPLMGSLTRITSSPKNLSALFDFAFLGPLLGFLSSIAFFGAGLLATKAALDGDASAAQFLPALPVSVVKLSTLGGSIVDNFFGGADGVITSQDPKTAIPLHPFAIAGFCGLMINAAEMLPLGSNDGGRMSQALFGRRGHSIIRGVTWFALLAASFTLEEQQAQVLVTAWVINNVVQNDMEVPCRDETDEVDLSRILAAFAMWFFALLTIIPMSN
jgi:hypothetical protein